MSCVRGTLEANINLSKATCYFLRTGQCSLHIIGDFYISPTTKTSANDLLYCPRLYRAMCRKERMKPISIVPCECGHAEVISGHQRACIASQKNLQLSMRPTGDKAKTACQVCGGQVTFDGESGGNRIVTLKALVYRD